MREYGQIQCSLWTDPEIQSCSDDGKLTACYLLTGPHSNGIGCYRLPVAYVVGDFGWAAERVSKAFAELSRIGFAEYCEDTQFILMPNFLAFNPIGNNNIAKNREKEFRTVPKGAWFHGLLAASILKYGNHLSEGFETLLKGFAEQDPTRPDPKGTEKKGSAGAPPDCPHQEILDLYHELLPSLPRVRIWTDERKSLLRTRWRESEARQNLDWWRKLFEYVGRSEFLMGRVRGRADSSPFMADLEWIIRPKNLVKIIEGKYEGRSHE